MSGALTVIAGSLKNAAVSAAGGTITVNYLIVAGGGAGGARGSPNPTASGYAYGAGGGAGGVLHGSVTLIRGVTYTANVGAGGAVTASTTLGPQRGGNGGPSTFTGSSAANTINFVAIGGGGGGGASSTGSGSIGGTGGAGGGGAVWRPTSSTGIIGGYVAGPGNTTQGRRGGDASSSGPPAYNGSGGGGGGGPPTSASEGGAGVRQAPPSPNAGISNGGAGWISNIRGTAPTTPRPYTSTQTGETRVGGGGQGGGFGTGPSVHPSSTFGGGIVNFPVTSQRAGWPLQGGGGASGTLGSQGGGSGIVIISALEAAVSGPVHVGSDGAGNTYYMFPTSGTIQY